MLNINILRKGDDVLTINERFLAVKRKNGEIDIFNVYFNEEGIFVDPVKTAVIGYGNGIIEKQLDDGETTIFRF